MAEAYQPNFELKEKESKRIAARYYFFRHDKPIYSDELADLMSSHGYQTSEYSGAEFVNNQEIPQADEPFHPSDKQLKKFAGRGRSETQESIYNLADRVKFEGITREPDSRENLKLLPDILGDENAVPFIITGPRTRHGFTAQNINKNLKDQGVEIDPQNVIVTDLLTDLNKHWICLTEIAEELGLKSPWEVERNPKYEGQLAARGVESMKDIQARVKHYLQVLERLFRKQKTTQPALADKHPVVIGISSDFAQRALLKTLGLEEVNGQPVLEFQSGVGSYVEVEVLEDGKANVYYQDQEHSEPQLLTSVENFHQIINNDQK
jgi:hypothetical protein